MRSFPTRYTGIDTNVLLRYLLRDDAAQYAVASNELEQLNQDHAGFVTQVTLAEIYWVISRSKKLTRTECLTVMRHIIETGSFEFDDSESVGRALSLAEDGADFADALIQGTMELFGIDRTVTFDQGAARHLGWELLPAEVSAS